MASSDVLTRDDMQIVEHGPGSRMLTVLARRLRAFEWPEVVKHKGRQYRFLYAQPMTFAQKQLHTGLAVYGLIEDEGR